MSSFSWRYVLGIGIDTPDPPKKIMLYRENAKNVPENAKNVLANALP